MFNSRGTAAAQYLTYEFSRLDIWPDGAKAATGPFALPPR
jgi:hypothetical protein